MKRLAAITAAILFMVATVVIPAVHSAHCHHTDNHHSTCPICTVAAISLEPPVAFTGVVQPADTLEIIPADFQLPQILTLSGPYAARAPPAA